MVVKVCGALGEKQARIAFVIDDRHQDRRRDGFASGRMNVARAIGIVRKNEVALQLMGKPLAGEWICRNA